jgi:hypothetical protein
MRQDANDIRRGVNSNTRVDDDTLLTLAAAGKSSRDMERVLNNIDHATICRRLKHLTPRQSTEIFKSYKADILAEQQRKIMMRCDRPGGNKLTPREWRDIAVTLGVLMDHERRERGLHEDKTRPLVMIFDRCNVQANMNGESAEKLNQQAYEQISSGYQQGHEGQNDDKPIITVT